MTIPHQTDGPLAGFSAVNINQDLFAQFTAYCEGRFSYQMGGKCVNPGQFPPHWALNGQPVNGCDCSGYARALLIYASQGVLASMPDGSYLQDLWFRNMGFKNTEYSNCGNANDNFVRVCIHRPGGRGGDSTGHVWICVHQHSVESHGGVGPGERPWNWQWFLDHVDDCFVLGPLV